MTSSVSFQLTVAETAFMFQLMGIPEGETMLEDFGAAKAENVPPEEFYRNVKKELEDAGLLQSDGNHITFELSILEQLKACKYSSASTRLEVHGTDGESSIIYAFVSGSQVVEMRWNSKTGDIILTSLKEGLEEQLARIGDRFPMPDAKEGTYRILMRPETLKRLQEQFGSADPAMHQAVLRNDTWADAQAAGALIEAFCSVDQWGIFETAIRGTEIRSIPVQFIASPRGHWLFMQKEGERVQGFQITKTELIQSLYLVAKRTLSIFAPG